MNVCVALRQMNFVKLLFKNQGNLICEIRFNFNCFLSKTLQKRMPGISVTCCGWAMLSDNDVRVMTSSLTPTSALLVKDRRK